MEIKNEKLAWQTLLKAQEVFKPILNFRFEVSVSSENVIEIRSPYNFRMWQPGLIKPLIFRGKNIIEAVNSFYDFFKKENIVYIKIDSEIIEFFAILYFRNNKWCLKKEKMSFIFFKKDGSLHNNLRPYPEEITKRQV